MVTTNIDEFVGKRLRARRKFLGLTQEAVANRLGVTFQQIQKYEKGKNRITSSILYELSQVLKVPIDYFFEGHDTKVQPDSKIEEKLLNSMEAGELVRSYEKIQCNKLKNECAELISSISTMYKKANKESAT